MKKRKTPLPAPTPPEPKKFGSDDNAKKVHLQDPFLANFLKSATILHGAKLTKIDPTTVSYWRQNDPEFEKKFQQTEEMITQNLVSAGMHRAIYGTNEYILHNGKLVLDSEGKPIVKKWHSDTLLMFFLKSRDRDKYSDRMKYDFDERIADQISAAVVAAVQKISPEFCPGCKLHLGLPAKMREELKSLSAKLSIS